MPPQLPYTALITPAFESWLQHQQQLGRLRLASSHAVYRAMWGALADWCGGQQPTLRFLSALNASTMAAYIASRDPAARDGHALTPRYQVRLLRLVLRVQRHAQALASAQRQADLAGPATAAGSIAEPDERNTTHTPAASLAARLINLPSWAGWAGGGNDAQVSPEHLSPTEHASLQRWLQAEPSGQQPWQQMRNRCATALQLGAGLTPGVLRSLRLADVLLQPPPALWLATPALVRPDQPASAQLGRAEPTGAGQAQHHNPLPWALQVPANGNAPSHLAPLADWVAALLAQWLLLRQQQAIGGPMLLPSTRSGKPWGKVAQYNAGLASLAAAGLDSQRAGGSFRLRHSFALRQLALGHAPDQVAQWLGVADPAVMARYQRAALHSPPITAVAE